MSRSGDQFQTINTEGAILPPDVLQRIATGELDGLDPSTYHLPTGTKTKEAISQSWTRLLRYWKDFQAARKLVLESDETGTLTTREKWLLPLFQELGYGRLTASKAPEIDGKLFPIERFWQHIPIHLIGCKLQLDHRTKGARGAATAIPHSMVQEFLNRSNEHQWAFLSNGLQLRLLRDSAALSRQSYVEFDLESMMDGEVYADFAVLWLVCHQSRLEGDKPEDYWLEKWSKLAQEQGTRILEDLRLGVQKAIEALGRGFVSHPRNHALIIRLQSGALNTQDYYRQILRIVYRLLFLFVAEDRGLLHPSPSDESLRAAFDAACSRYDQYYSLRRLRDLTESYRGSKHADLWHSLSLVFEALGKPEGCPQLALPALGSFLWSRTAIPDLSGPHQLGVSAEIVPVFIRNEDLLEAIRSLAFVERNRVLRAVNYRNLGSEELGSVYESLLELHPQINIPGRTFSLNTAAGNERKTTGSYYTPTSLVNCLLDSALEPVVADAIKGKRGPDAEKAILALKVCDPACGSGHFLIAAAHRLAHHLARARTGESEPTPADYQHGLRDVIGHCIYGVDLNPMAIELCKVSLWMEALEPGKPLGFLDHRIVVGNSLLGTTPALLSCGIPDSAFEPIEGDDKTYSRTFKKQNKDERTKMPQLLLYRDTQKPWEQLGNFATSLIQLDALPDDSVSDIRTKEQRYVDLVKSSTYESGRLLADAWCASFVWKKTKEFDYPITEKVYRDLERNPHSIPPWLKREIVRLSDQYQFFHWHLAFPDVFRPSLITIDQKKGFSETDVAGWTGGFDIVLGNPPWEHTELKEKEWFAERRPEISAAGTGSRRKRLIDALQQTDPSLYSAFTDAIRASEGVSTLARNSGRYPLTGRGRINTYALFAETKRLLLAPSGRLGCIVPSGIATDDTTRLIFQDIVNYRTLVSLYDFENKHLLFPDVAPVVKFSLLTISGKNICIQASKFVFFAWDAADIQDEARRFTLSPEDIALLNPNTRTCATFRSSRDADINKAIYRRLPILIDENPGVPNRWALQFKQGLFNMTSDSALFRDKEELEADGFKLIGANFVQTNSLFLPLYEPKLFHQFNHRHGSFKDVPRAQRFLVKAPTVPLTSSELRDHSCNTIARQWVDAVAVQGQLGRDDRWFAVFRDMTNVMTNSRNGIFCILPLCAVANSAPILLTDPPISAAYLVACGNAFVFDYLLRQKIGGGHINFYILKQIPAVPPTIYEQPTSWCSLQTLKKWILPRVLELSFTTWDLAAFAKDCGYGGPPFVWDDERRFQIRCELDAAYFHLYGIARDDVEYIMETFPIVKRKDEEKFNGDYRTKRVILEIYDSIADAIKTSKPYQTRLDPPPADPRVAHPLKPSTAGQVQRGKVVAYLTLLLYAWNKPVARDALEPSLIFMLNDNLRDTILRHSAPSQLGARMTTGEIVNGLDGLLGALQANGAVMLEDRQGHQTVRLGGSAGNVNSAPAADRQRAADAVLATQKLGEDRAMSYLDGIPEAEYDLVQ